MGEVASNVPAMLLVLYIATASGKKNLVWDYARLLMIRKSKLIVSHFRKISWILGEKYEAW